jgi:hypothetical protein
MLISFAKLFTEEDTLMTYALMGTVIESPNPADGRICQEACQIVFRSLLSLGRV